MGKYTAPAPDVCVFCGEDLTERRGGLNRHLPRCPERETVLEELEERAAESSFLEELEAL